MRVLMTILFICVGFGGYKYYQEQQRKEALKEIHTNALMGATKVAVDRLDVKFKEKLAPHELKNQPKPRSSVPPVAVLPVYNTQVCNLQRSHCNNAINIVENAPPNARIDQSAIDTVEWCKQILSQCRSMGY